LLKPIIDENHNTMCVIYEKELFPIELDPNVEYKLNEIIDGINMSFSEENITIEICVNELGFITISNKNGEHFDLDLKEKSIGPYLGFQETEYKGTSKYRSECPHMFLDQSYFMFIK